MNKKIKIASALIALILTTTPNLVKGEPNFDKVNNIIENEISKIETFDKNYNIKTIRKDKNNIIHATINYENNDKTIYIKYDENCNHYIELIKEFPDCYMYKCKNCETNIIITKISNIKLTDKEKYNIVNNIIENIIKPINNKEYIIETIIYNGTILNITLKDNQNIKTYIQYDINKSHKFKLEKELNENNIYKCIDCDNTIIINKQLVK